MNIEDDNAKWIVKNVIERFSDDISEDEIVYERRKTTEKIKKRRKETKKYGTTTEKPIKLLEDDDEINNDNNDDKIVLQRLGRVLKSMTKKRDLIGFNAAGEG